MGSEKSLKKAKRLREQIMFSIEPIPLKVAFNFQSDNDRKVQAFIGDCHEVIIDIVPESNVTITQMKMIIENVDFEALQ